MQGAVVRIGTAGWSLTARAASSFPSEGTHLVRYASRLSVVEINSSFYRPHRPTTYRRWADSVPVDFRFAVKVPRAITHERRLHECGDAVARFASEVAGLGDKLGLLLVQLPPSLAFEPGDAAATFTALAAETGAPLACEPRHPSWFSPEAEAAMAASRVARVVADPPRVADADRPGGWRGLAYFRLHGQPRVYYSDYDDAALGTVAAALRREAQAGIPVWCIFDNTALGHALDDALDLGHRLGPIAAGTGAA